MDIDEKYPAEQARALPAKIVTPPEYYVVETDHRDSGDGRKKRNYKIVCGRCKSGDKFFHIPLVRQSAIIQCSNCKTENPIDGNYHILIPT